MTPLPSLRQLRYLVELAEGLNFRAAAEQSIEALGGPVDLLLIHWPPPDTELDAFVDRLAEAHAAGLAKNIGVSNFPVTLMRRAAQRSSVKLINNQVEFHALIDQSKVMAEALQLGMTLSAYCPLGRGMVLKEPVTTDGRPREDLRRGRHGEGQRDDREAGVDRWLHGSPPYGSPSRGESPGRDNSANRAGGYPRKCAKLSAPRSLARSRFAHSSPTPHSFASRV